MPHERKDVDYSGAGQPATHAEAMGILTGFARAAVDHLIETKGLDSFDRDEVKREAERQLAEASCQDYN
ncbi:DUF3759 domain-containing protein [Aspergillus fischeri NRRL 181]|uniref:Uncharacterized protein n=1 Tax=Neosartorya fischeri (strain ATCC 1020 / DSM 3700 / CBS 544.65 / FGSC A1164 / JCM 1740 / NRRL 181 / WB 181) TaxID=331117 RepID=A1D923_NEOFI|nr:conserved hypothetical protein [Aspergillus fischeri NRRL 181]EAW20884.1 conserved hypothetical protein [Aspergillus fischeri NRRL 181]